MPYSSDGHQRRATIDSLDGDALIARSLIQPLVVRCRIVESAHRQQLAAAHSRQSRTGPARYSRTGRAPQKRAPPSICAVPDRRLHSIHRSGGERLSSCRKRLRSTSRPRLALHEALPLDFKLEGTTTVGDQILIRPRRGDWSRSTGQSVFCFHSSGLQRFWPRREKPSLFRPLRQFVDRRPIPGLRAGSG